MTHGAFPWLRGRNETRAGSRRLPLALCFALLAALTAPAAAADDELAGRSDPVARYVESFLARGKLQAENELTAGEIERLRRLAGGSSSSPAILVQLRSLDAPIRQSLASAAGEATRPPIADLKSASRKNWASKSA